MYHSNYMCQLRMLFTSASGVEQNINDSSLGGINCWRSCSLIHKRGRVRVRAAVYCTVGKLNIHSLNWHREGPQDRATLCTNNAGHDQRHYQSKLWNSKNPGLEICGRSSKGWSGSEIQMGKFPLIWGQIQGSLRFSSDLEQILYLHLLYHGKNVLLDKSVSFAGL